MAANILSNTEQAVIFFSAQGKEPSEIVDIIGGSVGSVRTMLTDERVQFEIKLLRHKLYGKDVQKRFKDMLPKALDTVEGILDNPNTKPGLGFAAAQEVFDRSLGKPKQTLELEGSLLKKVFERLDADEAVPIDITPGSDVVRIANPEQPVKSLQGNPNLDPIDTWAKENL